jgi:hypothetical protein
MSKEDLIAEVKILNDQLNSLQASLEKTKTEIVTKSQTRGTIENLAKKWFEKVEPFCEQFGIQEQKKMEYHAYFTQLLNLSLKPSKKRTYQKVLQNILCNLKEDCLIPIIKTAGKITSISNLTKILENVTIEEKDYLNEALGCAQYGFFRASMVLVWSAAVNRIQRIVEKMGIENFNSKTQEMKGITEGRFKRFKKTYCVHSLSELRATVFDTDLLWVLEYWGLIDANQHSRLEICFTMRNNAAHPGEATITEPNLASAFSDLKTIVFDNPKFKL